MVESAGTKPADIMTQYAHPLPPSCTGTWKACPWLSLLLYLIQPHRGRTGKQGERLWTYADMKVQTNAREGLWKSPLCKALMPERGALPLLTMTQGCLPPGTGKDTPRPRLTIMEASTYCVSNLIFGMILSKYLRAQPLFPMLFCASWDQMWTTNDPASIPGHDDDKEAHGSNLEISLYVVHHWGLPGRVTWD